ncbi:MAG TPA: hypothetical protein VFF30_15190 [Nitrososphaerales archaeon]|nr:hypothetical protein [Nitrososphaerales archaeon]
MPKFACPQCEETSDDENTLAKHGISEHGTTGVRPKFYPVGEKREEEEKKNNVLKKTKQQQQ